MPAYLREAHRNDGNLGLDKKNGSENGNHLDYESEVDLRNSSMLLT